MATTTETDSREGAPVVTASDLETVFRDKFGDLSGTGWGPRMRRRFGHFTPDEHYEALVSRLVREGTTWLDVGSGRNIFPGNETLARRLAERCRLLVGVDPDETIEENAVVHEKVRCGIEDYRPGRTFDLVTMRMVAEHITDPSATLGSLAELTAPGSLVVIYTINLWSPVSIISKIVPDGLHQPIKRIVWRTDEKDTFPVAYKMNTRGRLRRLFADRGFEEVSFAYLDDCRSTARFRALQFLELSAWKLLRLLHVRYPENCLLGVYRRAAGDPAGPGSSS